MTHYQQYLYEIHSCKFLQIDLFQRKTEINLANSLIKPFLFLNVTFFLKKEFDRNFSLYIHHWLQNQLNL